MRLKKYAKHVVEETFQDGSVTPRQAEKARQLYNELTGARTLDEFNGIILQILSIAPRKCRHVEDYLASSESDFPAVTLRENSIITAMETVTGSNTKVDVNAIGFDKKHFSIHPATDKQKEAVMKHLSNRLQGKVKNVWRIIDRKQKKEFDSYLEENQIKKVRQFWHGSRNENWLSIVSNSLQLHPDAVITGKMFGEGIYFAPSSEKSFGYTSYNGSYWASGSDDTGFMGLYATAYGHPLDLYDSAPSCSKRMLKASNADCVHAHAGSLLRNDEVIFFDERAVLLQYLVEFN